MVVDVSATDALLQGDVKLWRSFWSGLKEGPNRGILETSSTQLRSDQKLFFREIFENMMSLRAEIAVCCVCMRRVTSAPSYVLASRYSTRR